MNEALQQSLYDKLSREQDKYRDWLKGQPPEEILHHSYEYTVREDILMSMEELTLSEAETRALLLSPSPMAILYDKFSDLETGYMDTIRDSIEDTDLRKTITAQISVLQATRDSLYQQYKELADKEHKVIFGGRLGGYKYYDMDKVIAAALEMCEKEL